MRVTCEAHGTGADGASIEDPVQKILAAPTVLVSKQGVYEGVRGSLAVGQALGQHTPVGADGCCGEEFHQPVERWECVTEGHVTMSGNLKSNNDTHR